jgi:hypothetical protein
MKWFIAGSRRGRRMMIMNLTGSSPTALLAPWLRWRLIQGLRWVSIRWQNIHTHESSFWLAAEFVDSCHFALIRCMHAGEQAARTKLVPSKVRENEFWRNYFYKCDMVVNSYLKMTHDKKATVRCFVHLLVVLVRVMLHWRTKTDVVVCVSSADLSGRRRRSLSRCFGQYRSGL